MNSKKKYVIAAVLSALLSALNAPFAKLLMTDCDSTMLGAWLYLGAGLGTLMIYLVKQDFSDHFEKKDYKYLGLMVICDILAVIFLMKGLSLTSSATVSLLSNFEIVATALIAYLIFKEKISLNLRIAIVLITIAGILLSLQNGDYSFSSGGLLVIMATLAWGLENNCTKSLANHDPLKVTAIKGLGTGIGSLVIALSIGQKLPGGYDLMMIMLLGFVSYGLSVTLYIYAQRKLGAGTTSAYYALAPFISTILSLVIFKEIPGANYWIGLMIMIVAVYLLNRENLSHNQRLD